MKQPLNQTEVLWTTINKGLVVKPEHKTGLKLFIMRSCVKITHIH